MGPTVPGPSVAPLTCPAFSLGTAGRLVRRPRSPATLAREAVCPPSATVPAASRRVPRAGRRRPDISHRVPGPEALPAPWSRPSAPDSLSGRTRTGVSGAEAGPGVLRRARTPRAGRPSAQLDSVGPGAGRGAVGAASPGASLPLGRHPPHSHPPGRQCGLGAARAPFSASRLGGPRPDPRSPEPECHPGSTAWPGPRCRPRAQLLVRCGHSLGPCPPEKCPAAASRVQPPTLARPAWTPRPSVLGEERGSRRVLGSVWGCFESGVLNVQGLHRLDFPPNIRSRPVTSKSQIT